MVANVNLAHHTMMPRACIMYMPIIIIVINQLCPFQILLEVKQRKQPLLSPKNIPDWFLFFLESQRFAVLKTKWLCIFYVKLYWISLDFYGFLRISMDFFLSPVTNKINTLGMEANTRNGRFCYIRRFLS